MNSDVARKNLYVGGLDEINFGNSLHDIVKPVCDSAKSVGLVSGNTYNK